MRDGVILLVDSSNHFLSRVLLSLFVLQHRRCAEVVPKYKVLDVQILPPFVEIAAILEVILISITFLLVYLHEKSINNNMCNLFNINKLQKVHPE